MVFARFVIAVLVMLAAAVWSPASALEATLVADTYTSSAEPAARFGAAAGLSLRADGRDDRVFLKFALDHLPGATTGTDVARAILRLWVSEATTRGAFAVHEVLGP